MADIQVMLNQLKQFCIVLFYSPLKVSVLITFIFKEVLCQLLL